MFTTSKIEVAKGNAPDAYVTVAFTCGARYLDLKVWDKPILLRLSYDGVNFFDPMEEDPVVHSFARPIFFQAKAFQIQNLTPLVVGRYEIVHYS